MARSAKFRLTPLPTKKDAIMNSKHQTRAFAETDSLSASAFLRRSALFTSTAIARLAGLAIFGMALGSTAQAQSLPTGGSVSSGKATVSAGSNRPARTWL
jgi:hypothetical protein